MDATKFILDTRLELLDYANDYGAYADRLSARLKSTKKRLRVQDKNPAKHHSNLEVDAADLARNKECVHPLVPCWTRRESRRCARADRLEHYVG